MDNLNTQLSEYQSFINRHSQHYANKEKGIFVQTDINEIKQFIEYLQSSSDKENKPSYYKNVGVVYEDEYLWFLCDVVKFEDDRINLHHRIIRKGGSITGVAVVGKFKERIVLLRHFRHPQRTTFLEIPRGGVIEGKSPEESIVQEIQEEIGGTVSRLEKLQIIHPSTSIDTASIQCYYCDYVSITKPSVEEGIMEIVCMTSDEIVEAIAKGEISDAVTICAFYQAILHGFI